MKLHNPQLGTDFELNDHRGGVVGIATVASSGLFGTPTLYTTYTRAVEYIPTTRYTTSYILVEPNTDADIAHIKRVVASLGYAAYTKNEFMQRIARFYKYETSLGTNILLMTGISFIVGLSISGQTFYTFILENLEKFGALKAIGAKSHGLVAMILFQATFTALTGDKLRVGLCAESISLRAAAHSGLRGDYHVRQSRARVRGFRGGHRDGVGLRYPAAVATARFQSRVEPLCARSLRNRYRRDRAGRRREHQHLSRRVGLRHASPRP
ncbi:hypothetical protein OKW30_008233 [Paraburkholderia sp. Clong3]